MVDSVESPDSGTATSPTAPSAPFASSTDTRETRLIVRRQDGRAGFWSWLKFPVLVAGLAFGVSQLTSLWGAEVPLDPTDYIERSRRILKTTPLIDGHNDLPWQLRVELQNRIYSDDLDFTKRLLGHTDLQRMRQGMMGGQFWSVYVNCNPSQTHFEDASWVVRDTLEQIDVTRRFINEHPKHLQYCDSAACVRAAFANGRIASMIGIEGGHQVGGSIASIRQFYNLGARYITLTHNCDNSFGTAASTVQEGGPDHGLFELGYDAVKEMNRLGMLVDLSHVSHKTMRDVLRTTRSPIIFSHSGAYGLQQHLRHVPDDVIQSVKDNGGIIMVPFVSKFLNMKNPERASIHDVVEHILYIAERCGWTCVGVGSDFSGTPTVATGLEDVSKFPDLVYLLMERGVTDEQIRLFVGENILRVWAGVEKRAIELQASGEKPCESEYSGRSWQEDPPTSPWMFRASLDKALARKAAQIIV